jgi:hypothetical protein
MGTFVLDEDKEQQVSNMEFADIFVSCHVGDTTVIGS